MKRAPLVRLTWDSIKYGGAQAVGRGLQMILVPIFTRVFSPAEYGVIDVLALVATVAAVLIIMGTDSALSRFYYEAGDAEQKRTLVGTLALWRAGLALGIAMLLWAFAPLLSRVILASPDYAKYVRITAWSLPFTVFVYFENDVLRTTFQPGRFFALNVINTLAVAGVSILFVVGLKKGVSGVLFGRLAGDGLSALVGLALIRGAFAVRFDRPLLARLLAFSVPLIPAVVAYWAISYADRWVLVHYTNLTLVGMYALAVKLSMVMVLGTSAFQLAWGPFAFEHARDPESGRTFSRVLTLYAAVASFLALALGMFAPEFLGVLAPAAYHGAAEPGALLVFGVVALGGYSLAGMGANLAYRTELTAWCSGVAAVVTIGLALLLVRPYGALGVATATLIGFASSTALLYVASQRVHPLPYRGLRALFLFALAIAVWASATLASGALAAGGRFALGVGLRIVALTAFALVALWLARRIPLPVAPAGPAAAAASAGA